MKTAAGVLGALVLLGQGAGVARFEIYEGGKLGFMDRAGTVVVSPRYDGAWRPTEGLAAVTVDGHLGYVDKTGTVVIQSDAKRGHGFHEGLACVSQGEYGPYGYIDKSGKVVIPIQFEDAFDFSEGLARVQVGGSSNSGGFGYGKLWTVEGITALRVMTESFPADDPNYDPNDTGMQSIQCRIERGPQ